MDKNKNKEFSEKIEAFEQFKCCNKFMEVEINEEYDFYEIELKCKECGGERCLNCAEEVDLQDFINLLINFINCYDIKIWENYAKNPKIKNPICGVVQEEKEKE